MREKQMQTALRGEVTPGTRVRIEAREAKSGQVVGRTTPDGAGRFRLQLPGKKAPAIDLVVLASRCGTVLASERGLRLDAGQVHEIRIELPPAPGSAPKKSLPTPDRSTDLVPVQRRVALAQSLRGLVSLKDGRPQVPAWVNATIGQANRAGWMAGEILQGNLRHAEAFVRLLGSPAPGGAGAPGYGPLGPGGEFPAHALTHPADDRVPCSFEGGPAVGVVAAAAYLEVLENRRLGDLIQYGSLAKRAAGFVKERFASMEAIKHAVAGHHRGEVGRGEVERMLGGDGQEGEPLDLPPTWGLLPSTLGPSGPPPAPSACKLWVDCVDELVEAASSYKPAASCPDEEKIGSITPAAVCEGAEDVVLEIRPRPGETFSGTGICNVLLQRGLNYRKRLEILDASSASVRVRLDKAEKSGCIGFRAGKSQSSSANHAFLGHCFRMGNMVATPVLELLKGNSSLARIQCTGKNRFSVVGDPVLLSVGAQGPGGGSAPGVDFDAYLLEEACKDVELQWSFGFSDPSVSPEDHIVVRIESEQGEVLIDNLANEGTWTTNATNDRTYVIRARSGTAESTCGDTPATVRVERENRLHLALPSTLRTGDTHDLTVEASCPSPLDRMLSFSTSDPARLEVRNQAQLPAGDKTLSVPITAKGDACGQVTVTVSAPEHLPATGAVEVYDRPSITQVSPTQVRACDGFEVQVLGSCFAPGNTDVLLVSASGTTVWLDVTETEADQVRATGSDVEPGAWRLVVRSRGLESDPVTIQALPVTPTIASFFAWPYPQYEAVDVGWDVRDAASVLVEKDGAEMYQEDLGPCGGDHSDLQSGFISPPTTYTLKAFPVGGGAPVVEQRTVEAWSTKKVKILNSSGKPLVLWKIAGAYADSQDIPQSSSKSDLDHDEEIEVSLGDASLWTLIAIDKDEATAQGYDPDGNAIEVNNLRQWEAVFHGSDEGEVVVVTIL